MLSTKLENCMLLGLSILYIILLVVCVCLSRFWNPVCLLRSWNSVSVYRGPETQVLRVKCSNTCVYYTSLCKNTGRRLGSVMGWGWLGMVEAGLGMNVQTYWATPLTGPVVQADRSWDELGLGWDLYTLISRPAFRSTGPGPSMSAARDDFHAWRSGQPGLGWSADRAWDDQGLQILLRSRYEKYWGLNFGSHHTPVWGRLSTKGNRPEEVIKPVPWAHYKNSIK
jgi:hypothetical protein